MRLPYSWLRDVVSAGAPGWDVSADELEQTLIRIGHEVEEVIPVGPVTGPLTIGRVAEIEELTEFKKPIRAVKVGAGEAKLRDIVCGAANFAVGDLGAVALPADGEALPVTIEPGTGVMRFGLRPVTGIDPTAVSPWWMQRRLLLSGIRAISPAVDVTNYVMLEFGHPMHAHDRSLITGGFRVRFAEPGETVVTLDDVERKLDPRDVLIVDDAATAAIGGIMGAGTTEVRDTTTGLMLEAAVG